jgi:alkylhydroperoxidase family enzyme
MESHRIPPLEPPYPPEVAEDLEKMMPPGFEPLRLFRTLAHNPRILHKFRLSNLLDRGSIDRREREIVILRTCARCAAEYEWGVHVTFFAQRFGITLDQIAATVHGDFNDPAWSARDALLIRLVDELHDSARISDALWQNLKDHWQATQIIEFIVLAGFYHTVSFVINGAAIEREEGAATFPDQGMCGK